MPRDRPQLSIVVPVYGVADYLAQCLDSVLRETSVDVEVIAVDDASPDRCGEILDAYAGRDPRLRVVHLPENVGLGEARNVGLRLVRGDYVWFVDSDDWLPYGAVAAVATRLDEMRPDVLIVDFAVAQPDGFLAPHPRGHLFRAASAGTFRFADRPALLDLPMTAWNKVLRVDFLRSLGVSFGRGYYEDISVTYPVLIAAERLALLDEVCYHYRRGREGAITHTPSPKHFDIFPQYGAIFDFLDTLGAPAEPFRRAVFDRTVKHATTVYATPGLVPTESRRPFFREMSQHFRRFRPAGYRYPVGLRGLQYRLVESDAYGIYSALMPVNRLRLRMRGVRRRGRRARAALRRRATLVPSLFYFHVQKLLPVDDELAVYAAYWFRDFACNPRAIYEKAREMVPRVHGVWVVERDRIDRIPDGVDYVVAGSPAYFRAMARARYLVNNVNFPIEMSKRRGSIHVQTQHGTPLKTMGLDLRRFPVAAKSMNFDRLVEQCDRWDFLVSANPHTSEVWRRVYPGHYEMLETGQPRNDKLHAATPDDTAAVRASLGIGPQQTVVLYAPTHRERGRQATSLIDLRRLATALGPDDVVLVRAHYYAEAPEPAVAASGARIVDVTEHPSIEDLCIAADVLVTDYSSVLFDFAVLDRPIVVYAPDWDDYRWNRGVYIDLLAEPPGAVATTEDELLEVFATGAATAPEAKERLAAFRARFCPYDDGHAAERVVRRVFLGEAGDRTG